MTEGIGIESARTESFRAQSFRTESFRTGDVTSLESHAQGVILLDGSGVVVFANTAADALLGGETGLVVVGRRFSSVDLNVAQRLQGLIAAAASPRQEVRRAGLIAIPAPARRLPLLLSVAPLPPGWLPMFGDDPLAVASIIDPDVSACPPEAQLVELFGLTRAEVRVAHALLDGQSLREIARERGLSVHTVRSHVTRIFGKVGVRRQAELVRFLAQLPVGAPPPWRALMGAVGLPGSGAGACGGGKQGRLCPAGRRG